MNVCRTERENLVLKDKKRGGGGNLGNQPFIRAKSNISRFMLVMMLLLNLTSYFPFTIKKKFLRGRANMGDAISISILSLSAGF